MLTMNNYGQGDRPSGEVNVLHHYIDRACDISNYEPNLSLNLEIVDIINAKKGNTARDAAIYIAKYINSRIPHSALLACDLLSILVKNCGYPFHLQISTKDFLNELVRRFPERPPVRLSRPQYKILEMIEEWTQTICRTSRHKSDFGFIRDMHRLLAYKGYRFPKVKIESASVLNPTESIKSPEELEEEDREARSAKLQELIRRGTPADLEEANVLMKVLAGYDPESKSAYRAKAAEELEKVRRKALLLDEMLKDVEQGTKIGNGDVFEELVNSIISSQPRIMKWVEEESSDVEAVNKLLDLNDMLNKVISTFEDKSGKKLHHETGSKGASKIARTDLIDFDTSESAQVGDSQPSTSDNLIDDLEGLSFTSDQPFGQGGSIALGFQTNNNIPGPPLLSSLTTNDTAQSSKTQDTKAPSHSRDPSSSDTTNLPDYSAFSILNKPNPPKVAEPVINTQPQTSNAFQGLLPQFNSNGTTHQPTISARDSGDWEFASSIPKNEVLLLDSPTLKIDLHYSRSSQDNVVQVIALFSSKADSPITNITFQAAVKKGLRLQMDPQSGTVLSPYQASGISQTLKISGSENNSSSFKIRWKSAYSIRGQIYEDQGESTAISVV